jgi:hypothetical protein
MSQFPHDEFAKEYIPELIKNYGAANPGENISSERREIDVFFQPTQEVPTTPDTLGLLGKLAQKTVLFEVFRNPVESHQITECMGKLFDVQLAIRKEKKKNKPQLSSESEPFLWILTPTLSATKLESFRAENSSNWGQGIYLLAPALNTGIIIIHQLPVNRETLWLRILGRGKVQENAIDELKSLPVNYPHRQNVLELIGNLFAMLEANKKAGEKLEEEEQELIMKLSPIYVEKLEEIKRIGLQEGREEGLLEGLQQGLQQEVNLIIRLLKRKLGNLSPNLEQKIASLPRKTLEDLGEALLDFNTVEDLIAWLNNNEGNKA